MTATSSNAKATESSTHKKPKKTVATKNKRFSKIFLGKTKFHIRKQKADLIFGSKVRNGIYLTVLFFFTVIFFNLQPNSNSIVQLGASIMTEEPALNYIFYDQEGNPYNIFGQPTEHGAPQSWEYLFEGVEVSTGPDKPLPERDIPNTTLTGENELGEGNNEKTEEKIEETSDTKKEQKKKGESGKKFTFIINEGGFTGKALNVIREFENKDKVEYEESEKGIQIISSYNNCPTPWGYELMHGQSILAYQQDTNTPDTCNIERRFCRDGDLSGTFDQQSCSVNSEYSYFQEQFVSYNEPKTISIPSTTTVVSLPATTNGTTTDSSPMTNKTGIDEIIYNPNQQSTTRGDSSENITQSVSVEQSKKYYPDCKTPRGETVKHSQFVKAYKHKNGFNDAPCQVQLRACSAGQLEGSYNYSSCTYWETSYLDRLDGSPTWDTYSDAKMQWIKEIRESETNYKLEYGNTLNSSALDKILEILDM